MFAFNKLRGILAVVIVLFLSTFSSEPQASPVAAGKWKSDIDFIVSKVESIHPKPRYRLTEKEFKGFADEIKTELPQLDEEQITVRMMQLVARLGDGHTQLLPVGHKFKQWYPVRIDRFADGYYITAVSTNHENLLGSRVLRVCDIGIEEAFEKVATVASADSRYAWPKTVPPFFSNAAIMHALGIVGGEKLQIEILTPDNQHLEVSIPSVNWQEIFSWTRQGFRAPGGRDYVNVYDILNNRDTEIPLHLRQLGEKRYWFEFLPEHEALYVQFNWVSNDPDEPFAQFNQRLWKFYEDHSEEINVFILDMRYNDGGNGSLLQPLIHGFIRHENISRAGKLYCIVGPGTYSAATRCLGEMIQNTDVVVVGEATSGPLNWCSDYLYFELPSSGHVLLVSSLCWQRGYPSDTRGYFPPDYTVPVTATDLFAGRDKALEAILAGEVRTLDNILRSEGSHAFMAEYEAHLNKFASFDWWYPFTEYELQQLGLEMLQDERLDDAIAAFHLNSVRHPDSWEARQNLADCYRQIGDRKQAIQCYEESLELNPDNLSAQRNWRQLLLLHTLGKVGWAQALKFYRETRAKNPRAFGENEINNLGYASLSAGRTEEAIDIFRINTEVYPESFNAWDSFAEAHMVHGNNEKAILYYKKSFELNPENSNAAEKLRELGE
jgi:tetratricopeptide (TPR) repeat protein